MSERRASYQTDSTLLQQDIKCAIVEPEHRPLSTRNLDELERELAELERMLTPLVNKIRELRGKKPMFVPKG